ncbi:uncharacterized protein MKZ38_010581 [Zalerion maritima]|uniref:MARVEL domain-containing protein n=1 Tax=Zalerion maritima TaxID=339359 RepID=A0AAD5RT15_9PEZI|nr:uncharacterized protein MKZ38_010581 [Zalerion maritima]
MGSKSSFAFKLGQWIVRGLQICCAVVILAITCYFISTQDNRELSIWVWERAVAGISGAALLWFIAQALVLCCLAGFPITSGLAMFIDLLFIGGFMYIAWAYRDGASSCKGDEVDTPYGTGKDEWKIADHVGGNDGWTRLPTYQVACNMTRASLAIAIITIFALIISILVEFKIIKNRKADKATTASSSAPMTAKGKGLFGFRRRKQNTNNSNNLPHHPTPGQSRDVEKAEA